MQDGVVLDDDDGPLWNPKLAVELVGKRVLVGITDLAPDCSVLGRREFCGQAVRADWRTGIALRLEGPADRNLLSELDAQLRQTPLWTRTPKRGAAK